MWNKKIEETQSARLADELASLKAEVKALRRERDRTSELFDLEQKIVDLTIEKDKLVEDNARKIRETEHKVGLLKTKQDQDVTHATRIAKLEVREENLTKDQERFKSEMDFQRGHLQKEVERVEDILTKVLERVPVLQASLNIERGDSREDREDF